MYMQRCDQLYLNVVNVVNVVMYLFMSTSKLLHLLLVDCDRQCTVMLNIAITFVVFP